MLVKEEILKEIKEANLFGNLIFTKVWLVGSFARNEATEKSDIDFLIEYNMNELKKHNLDAWSYAQRFVEIKFSRKVQFITSDAYEKFGNSVEILIK